MRTSRVSVAMCTYNGVSYLREQFESIVNQTKPPDELVVCDDASTDGTGELAAQLARNAPFPVHIFINEKNLGPMRNFERAIRLCTGDFIFLSDQDDVWTNSKIDITLKAFELNPDAAYAFSDATMVNMHGVASGYTLWDSMGIHNQIRHVSGSNQVKLLLKRNIIPGAALAFRTTFKSFALPIAAGWMHDYWIVLLGSIFSYGVPIPSPLFHYRQHAGQVCGWRKYSFLQVVRNSLKSHSREVSVRLQLIRDLSTRVAHMSQSSVPNPQCLNLLKDKEEHLRARCAIRAAPIYSRIPKWLKEVLTGRYQRFSESWYSILRDL